MARVNSGSEDIFGNSEDIERYLLDKISKNDKRNVGTEVEFFFLDPQRRPITVKNSQRAFRAFRESFEKLGYATTIHAEEHDQQIYITSLAVNGIGNVDLETGHGFEFASTICSDTAHILETNHILFSALRVVEDYIDHRAVFQGYVPEYASPVAVKRARSHSLRSSYQERFGQAAKEILKVQGATASTQVNIDCCQNAFHEVFRVLLLVEPALTLHYADNSHRSFHRKNAYSSLVPKQVDPIVDAWNHEDNDGVIRCIVERLLEINVPFLPDSKGMYIHLPLDPATGQPPTVRDLMEQEKLTEKTLKNILPLFQTHPALRRPAVLELRGPDSLDSPEKIAGLAHIVTNICYEETLRQSVLEEFRYLASSDIRTLHELAAWKDKDTAMQQVVRGNLVKDFVARIVEVGQHPTRAPYIGFNQCRFADAVA